MLSKVNRGLYTKLLRLVFLVLMLMSRLVRFPGNSWLSRREEAERGGVGEPPLLLEPNTVLMSPKRLEPAGLGAAEEVAPIVSVGLLRGEFGWLKLLLPPIDRVLMGAG